MRYAIVIEKAASNYSAYVPDLPGCVATGATVADVEVEIRDAIRFHLDGLREDGLDIPASTSIADYVDAWIFPADHIIKLFSVMAVVLVPPTLIASIDGMNFKLMPELEWPHGYPFALALMVMAGLLPYLFFKWKKWL